MLWRHSFRTVCLFLCLLIPAHSWAAIAFDAASNGRNTSTNSITVAHTVGGGSDRVLLVCVAMEKSGGVATNTGVTYNGDAMTLLHDINISGTAHLLLWYLLNPDSGSNNIVSSWDASNDNNQIAAASYSGVDAVENGAEANDTTGSSNGPITVNVTSQAADLVVDCAKPFFALSVPSEGAGQTKRAQNDDTASSGAWLGMSEEAGAGTVTMSWTLNATPRNWATIGANLSAAGGGGGGAAPSYFPLLGVGP